MINLMSSRIGINENSASESIARAVNVKSTASEAQSQSEGTRIANALHRLESRVGGGVDEEALNAFLELFQEQEQVMDSNT